MSINLISDFTGIIYIDDIGIRAYDYEFNEMTFTLHDSTLVTKCQTKHLDLIMKNICDNFPTDSHRLTLYDIKLKCDNFPRHSHQSPLYKKDLKYDTFPTDSHHSPLY